MLPDIFRSLAAVQSGFELITVFAALPFKMNLDDVFKISSYMFRIAGVVDSTLHDPHCSGIAMRFLHCQPAQ